MGILCAGGLMAVIGLAVGSIYYVLPDGTKSKISGWLQNIN